MRFIVYLIAAHKFCIYYYYEVRKYDLYHVIIRWILCRMEYRRK